jgi:hypothetical protein
VQAEAAEGRVQTCWAAGAPCGRALLAQQTTDAVAVRERQRVDARAEAAARRVLGLRALLEMPCAAGG